MESCSRLEDVCGECNSLVLVHCAAGGGGFEAKELLGKRKVSWYVLCASERIECKKITARTIVKIRKPWNCSEAVRVEGGRIFV